MSTQTNSNPHTNDSETDAKKPARWRSFASSGGVVVGVAIAAAFTSQNAEKPVGIAAWVAVAVVGASTMISTARNVK